MYILQLKSTSSFIIINLVHRYEEARYITLWILKEYNIIMMQIENPKHICVSIFNGHKV